MWILEFFCSFFQSNLKILIITNGKSNFKICRCMKYNFCLRAIEKYFIISDNSSVQILFLGFNHFWNLLQFIKLYFVDLHFKKKIDLFYGRLNDPLCFSLFDLYALRMNGSSRILGHTKDTNRKIRPTFFIDYCFWILVPNS